MFYCHYNYTYAASRERGANDEEEGEKKRRRKREFWSNGRAHTGQCSSASLLLRLGENPPVLPALAADSGEGGRAFLGFG